MERSFDEKIEKLRKKSRTLINHLERTSGRANEKIEETGSQSLLHNFLVKSKSQEYWKMRNNSVRVGGILCPDYFHSGDNATENCGRKTVAGKILITSNGQSPRPIIRKPVKGCYCDARTNKLQSDRTTEDPSFPCAHCRNKFDIVQVDFSKNNDAIETANTLSTTLPPLSGKTLRKVENITYSPTSEFLRRVQKKVSSQQKRVTSNSSVFSTSSSSSRERSTRMTRDSGRGESATEIRCRGGKNTSCRDREVRSRSETRSNFKEKPHIDERRSFASCTKLRERNVDRRPTRSCSVYPIDRTAIRSDEKNIARTGQDVLRKSSSLMRKLITSSDRHNNDHRGCTKLGGKTKRIVRTISAHSRCCARENTRIPTNKMESRRTANKSCIRCDCRIGESPAGDCSTNWQLSRDTKEPIYVGSRDSQGRVRDLKKFRQENYFETHGSAQTLVASSRSSGSIEQYELNDRLFPEPVRRIHRDDIIVTIPPCATKQRKRIHYFPRHIVTQEKSISNTNYKKKRRSQSCGLTGHAIDLGVIKIPRELPNSLALKYQKGVATFDK